MGTIRQKRLAKALIENIDTENPKNKQELLAVAGYAKLTGLKRAGEVIESKGVTEELEIMGFTEANAKKVVAEIMLNDKIDPNPRLKATEQVFKVHGSYKNEGSTNNVMIINVPEQIAKKNVINPSTSTDSK